jgi:glycosyltransferase involved in cell wall biosynthesis
MRLSLVIPVKEEQESLAELLRQIREALDPLYPNDYEVLIVDDGSRDRTWKVIEELSQDHSMIRAWRFQSNLGKAAALTQAFAHCRGDDVVTLDGDLQDDPNEIPAMLEILDQGYHLVSGWKQKRHDPWHKTVPSRFFNGTVSFVAGQRLHDFNCGLKAYRSDVVRNLQIYGDYHRFIPLMASWMGFRITEKVVLHRPRVHGVSKYGWSRLISGFLDLVSLLFLQMFGRKPFHFFGTLGLLCSGVGSLVMMWFLWVWLSSGSLHVRPLMVFGITALLAGIQFVCLGLLGEMLNQRTQSRYFPITHSIDSLEVRS